MVVAIRYIGGEINPANDSRSRYIHLLNSAHVRFSLLMCHPLRLPSTTFYPGSDNAREESDEQLFSRRLLRLLEKSIFTFRPRFLENKCNVF